MGARALGCRKLRQRAVVTYARGLLQLNQSAAPHESYSGASAAPRESYSGASAAPRESYSGASTAPRESYGGASAAPREPEYHEQIFPHFC